MFRRQLSKETALVGDCRRVEMIQARYRSGNQNIPGPEFMAGAQGIAEPLKIGDVRQDLYLETMCWTDRQGDLDSQS